MRPLQVNNQTKQTGKQAKQRTYKVLCVDRIDTKSFFIFVLRVVDEDEYFSFSWKLLRSEAESNTVSLPRTNLEK